MAMFVSGGVRKVLVIAAIVLQQHYASCWAAAGTLPGDHGVLVRSVFGLFVDIV